MAESLPPGQSERQVPQPIVSPGRFGGRIVNDDVVVLGSPALERAPSETRLLSLIEATRIRSI
jgi:hypothetical protein